LTLLRLLIFTKIGGKKAQEPFYFLSPIKTGQIELRQYVIDDEVYSIG